MMEDLIKAYCNYEKEYYYSYEALQDEEYRREDEEIDVRYPETYC